MKLIVKSRYLSFVLIALLLLPATPTAITKASGLLSSGTQPSTASPKAKLSTPQLLEQALANGEITASERMLYLAYALYEPQSLPAKFQSNVGWYGTRSVLEVKNWEQNVNSAASAAIQQELGRLSLLAATVCDNEDGANATDSANFRFNYDTIGGGLAIADYSTSMEATFATEVTQFGWAKPPLCTGGATCDGNTNPFGKFPIQVAPLGAGLYGYVTTGGGLNTGFIGDNPHTPATETAAFASCMALNGDFSQFSEGAQNALDATTSHEFVHAIQNGYGDPGDVQEDAMWYESSAAYMEDEIFDASNSSYSYLWPVVSNCLGQWPNDGDPGGISQYSNFLFFRHVAEQFGGTNVVNGGENVMQHFWENVGAGQDGLVAYNNALVTAGTDLPNAFHNYAIAAKFSKACGAGYAAPYCFEEGAAYVGAIGDVAAVQGSITANPETYSGNIQDHYAVNWVSLPTSGSYQVTLSNTSGGQLRGSLVCDTGSAFTISAFPAIVGTGNATSIGTFDATGCVSVVAVITNQEQTSGNPNACTAHNYTVAVSAAQSNTPTPTIMPTSTTAPTPTSTPIPSATSTPTTTLTSIYLPLILRNSE